MKVLVVYASRYGSTEEIARRIGEVLKRNGFEVDVMPAANADSPDSYDAVVLGSAAYVFHWMRPAARYLRRYQRLLSQRPVWLFSSGPTGDKPAREAADGFFFPKSLQEAADQIGPRDVTLFHGAVIADRLTGLHRWMLSKVDAPTGDFRDWNEIESWAGKVAAELRGGAGPVSGSGAGDES
jgi:menaquinone-dependent protoporphyrinogen oxidase